MKVVILAAGRGTRLGKLTEENPKCMLPVGNSTILEREIELLKSAGVQEKNIIVVAGYHADIVMSKVENVIVDSLYYRTDNAHSLLEAVKDLDDDVLVLDGDLVFDENTTHEILSLTRKKHNICYCTKTLHQIGDTGVVLSEDGKIVEIGKHIEKTDIIFQGIFYITKSNLPQYINKLIENQTGWYTIALNEYVKEVTFIAQCLSNKIIGVNSYFDYICAKNFVTHKKLNIAITGATGFLGKKVNSILARDYHTIGLKSLNNNSCGNDNLIPVDICSKDSVNAFFNMYKPEILINCAGMAEPESCDINRDTAIKLNVEAVKNLRDECEKYGTKLIHISTDYVFDGYDYDEYEIDSKMNPLNYYGYTKSEAEKIVCEYKNSLIIRIPIIYGFNSENDKKTFPIRVIESLSKGHELKLDNKQIRYPVLIDEIALMISSSLNSNGYIHISSEKPVTKYTWAKEIARVFGLDESLIKEDVESDLKDRPPHTKLKIYSDKYIASDISEGTNILRKQMFCVFRLIYASKPDEYIYNCSVGEYRFKLGEKMGSFISDEIKNQIDCVVPVPSSGIYYAQGIAKSINKPYIQGLVKTDVSARSFQITDNEIRQKIINEKIIPISELLKNKNIALVDEAIFTGTTLKTVCDICKACGVKSITIFIPTPICHNRCHQYVRPERQLLSEIKKVDDLKNYFGVKNVIFQTEENFKNSLKDINYICCECFEKTI